MEILLATHNQHKKEEIQQILGENYYLTSLTDYHIFEEIEEMILMPISTRFWKK